MALQRFIALLVVAGCDHLLQLDDIHVTDAPAADITTGLVAYYPLDMIGPDASCAADASGNGHVGACANGLPTVAAGKIGGAFEFAGSVVTIAHSNELDSETGTVAFWVQLELNSNALFECPVNRQYGDPTLGANSWQVCINQINTTVYFGSNTRSIEIDRLQASDGKWHHIAMAWSSQQIAGWYDGTPMFTLNGPVMFDGSDISLGTDVDDTMLTAPLIGRLDEVRLYNRVLADLDVGALAAM